MNSRCFIHNKCAKIRCQTCCITTLFNYCHTRWLQVSAAWSATARDRPKGRPSTTRNLIVAATPQVSKWVEQGLTSHQTHYRSYWGLRKSATSARCVDLLLGKLPVWTGRAFRHTNNSRPTDGPSSRSLG